MLMKTVTYENFNGEKKQRNCYFHLSKTEIARMQATYEGGIAGYLQRMIDSNNTKELFKFFEDFVLACYGEKSSDGEEFLKSEEIRYKFQCHPAYDVLMMEFIDGGDQAMAAFINSIIPKDLQQAIENNKTAG